MGLDSNHIARRRQRGAMGIVTILLIILVIVPFGAFFMDLARMYVSRNEVQNGADAAAQVGAAALWPPSAGAPNWDAAVAAAQGAVGLNKVRSVTLTGSELPTSSSGFGYWNLNTGILESKDITPTAQHVPAVQVSIPVGTDGSGAAVNGGPVQMLFSALTVFAGGSTTSLPVKGRATAISSVGGTGPGALAPYAMSLCAFDRYWNSSTASPKLDSDGKPFEIALGDKNDCKGATVACECGESTSLNLGTQNVDDLRTLINNGNTAPLVVYDPANPSVPNDQVWIHSGLQANLFNDNQASYATLLGQKIAIPVVDFNGGTCVLGSWCNIMAFACLQLDLVVKNDKQCANEDLPAGLKAVDNPIIPGGSNKSNCLIVKMTTGCTLTGGGSGGGTYFGAASPPQIVQ